MEGFPEVTKTHSAVRCWRQSCLSPEHQVQELMGGKALAGDSCLRVVNMKCPISTGYTGAHTTKTSPSYAFPTSIFAFANLSLPPLPSSPP